MSKRIFLAPIGLLLLSALAQANPVVYTSSAAWSAATSDVTNVNFAMAGYETYYGSGYSSGDVTLTGAGTYLFGWGPGSGSGYNLGIGNYLLGPGSGNDITESFSGEDQAVDTDVAIYYGTGTVDYQFTTHDGDTGSGSVAVNEYQLGYIGLVADPGDWITSLTVNVGSVTGGFESGYDNIIVGSVDYGEGSATPEPGSLALLGSGALGLAGFFRCRRRVVTGS
jgi:hypothetical protein